MTTVYTYWVSVDEMIFQDEDALHGLEDRMLASYEQLLQDDNRELHEVRSLTYSRWGKPLRSYEEDGKYTGMHVLYQLEGYVL